MAARDGCQEAARIPGRAAQLRREHHGPVAQAPCRVLGTPAELAHAANDARLHVVQRLGGLLVHQRACAVAQAQVVALHDVPRGLRRLRIRTGGAGGDGVRRVAQHVREDDGVHPRRSADLCKAPALHAREPLADGVDLADVRPAGEHLARHILKLLAGNQRRFKERGAAAGEQKDNLVPLAQRAHQLEHTLSGPEGVLVRNRMSRLVDLHARNLSPGMLILGDDRAAHQAIAQHPLRRRCHGPRRLADSHQIDPVPQLNLREGAQNRRVRHCVRDGRANDHICVRAQGRCLQSHFSFLQYIPIISEMLP